MAEELPDQQVRRDGRRTPERKYGRNPRICMAKGCFNKPIAKGYCWKHYQQIRRHGRLTPEREHRHRRAGCLVEGCKGKYYARGYCERHYMQRRYAQRKTGEISWEEPEQMRRYGTA